MPSGKTYGNVIRPSGQQQMDGFTSSESPLARFLYPLRWRDTVFVVDDFVSGNTTAAGSINLALWTFAKIASNGTNFAATSTQLANGTITGITGAVAGDHVNIRGGATWAGDYNCGFEIRWKVDNNVAMQWETGFSDPLSSYTNTATSVINDIDTPTITNGATDVAMIAMDTQQTLTTMAFITDGSTSNMNTTKTNLGTRTPTNATFMTCRVQLAQTASAVAASAAYVLDVNNALQEQASHGSVLASQIKGDVLLEPRFYMEAATTTAETVDIDYMAIWQDRFKLL